MFLTIESSPSRSVPLWTGSWWRGVSNPNACFGKTSYHSQWEAWALPWLCTLSQSAWGTGQLATFPMLPQIPSSPAPTLPTCSLLYGSNASKPVVEPWSREVACPCLLLMATPGIIVHTCRPDTQEAIHRQISYSQVARIIMLQLAFKHTNKDYKQTLKEIKATKILKIT